VGTENSSRSELSELGAYTCLEDASASNFERNSEVCEASRKKRCTRVQRASLANGFMRQPARANWLSG
jgi:hypothetical protein